MSVVRIPEMKSRIEDGPEGLRFNIPSRRVLFAALFLPVWLVGWCFGEVSAIREISRNLHPFMIVWLTGWTIFGPLAAFTWMWNLAGWERVLLKPGTLVHRYDVFGIGRGREYNLAHVRNLRVSVAPAPEWWKGRNQRT